MNNVEQNSKQTNAVTSVTWWNFIFLNLFKQMRRPANIYFTVICVLQTLEDVTITKGRPTLLLPFGFVLIVAAIKDAIEDYGKHKADAVQNSRTVDVLDVESGKFVERKWHSVRVGNTIRVKNREFVPADLLVLGSSDQVNNGVFINTKNLDGETDLKIREVPNDLVAPVTDPDDFAKNLGGHIVAEAPSKNLIKFEGTHVAADGATKTRSP